MTGNEDLYSVLNTGLGKSGEHMSDLRKFNTVTEDVDESAVKLERKPADLDTVVDIIDHKLDLKLDNNSPHGNSVSDIKPSQKQPDFDTTLDIVQSPSKVQKPDLKAPIISVKETKKMKAVDPGIVFGKGPPGFLTQIPEVQLSNVVPIPISYSDATPKRGRLNAGNILSSVPATRPRGEGIISVTRGIMADLPAMVYSDWHMGCLEWVVITANMLQTHYSDVIWPLWRL